MVCIPIEQQVVFSRAQRAVALAMTIVTVMACLASVYISDDGPQIREQSLPLADRIQRKLATTALNTFLLFPVRQVLRRGIKAVHEKRSCTESDLRLGRSAILRLRYREYQFIRSSRYGTL